MARLKDQIESALAEVRTIAAHQAEDTTLGSVNNRSAEMEKRRSTIFSCHVSSSKGSKTLRPVQCELGKLELLKFCKNLKILKLVRESRRQALEKAEESSSSFVACKSQAAEKELHSFLVAKS